MIEISVTKLSGFAKNKGLLGFKKPKTIYFKTRFGIHTFGMNFPIDVLVLDKDDKVVKLKENLKPNRVFIWNPHFEDVIELGAGNIKKLGIKLGDELKIEIN